MKPAPVQKQDILIDLDRQDGGAQVRAIRESLIRGTGMDIQYLDMKQRGDILARFRSRVRLAVRQVRAWKAAYEAETDTIEKVYSAYEGIFIRRQFADVWQLYVTVNRDYHEMRRVYLANLRQPPHRRVVS